MYCFLFQPSTLKLIRNTLKAALAKTVLLQLKTLRFKHPAASTVVSLGTAGSPECNDESVLPATLWCSGCKKKATLFNVVFLCDVHLLSTAGSVLYVERMSFKNPQDGTMETVTQIQSKSKNTASVRRTRPVYHQTSVPLSLVLNFPYLGTI